MFFINEIFNEIGSEKREKILDAAFHEFAEHGYDGASTNRIVKSAEISKGMLFYYFNSKEELYHDLINYAVTFINENYISKIDGSQRDFIERWKKASTLKLKTYIEHPEIYNFLFRIYLKGSDSRLSEVETKALEGIKRSGLEKIWLNVDMSVFRNDINEKSISDMIGWITDGYASKLSSRFKNAKLDDEKLKSLTTEFYEYLETLKTLFYKQ